MPFAFLANLVVVLHLLFILFVVLGGLLVLYDRRWAWLHIPAAVWGAVVELAGWICPLTPLENWLRISGGGPAYPGDFVERYIVGLIYPAQITRQEQIMLGLAVLLLNGAIYGRLIWKEGNFFRKPQERKRQGS